MLSVPWTEASSANPSDPPKYIGHGAAIEQLAKLEPEDASLPDIPRLPIAFPRQSAFSYAGLVSQVQRFVGKQPPERIAQDTPLRIAIARRFQEAAFGQVEDKVRLALKRCEAEGVGVTSLVVSGGVASNLYLRERSVLF
jgi:N6-L-threonylcarbamoyladenine synthase